MGKTLEFMDSAKKAGLRLKLTEFDAGSTHIGISGSLYGVEIDGQFNTESGECYGVYGAVRTPFKTSDTHLLKEEEWFKFLRQWLLRSP
jgi:hypothetical protein